MKFAADAASVPAELRPAGLTDMGAQLLQVVSGAVGTGTTGDGHAPPPTEWQYREVLNALGVAVYTTDAAGRITFFNEAAVTFWGRRPELGEEWCGSWRLYTREGLAMRHDECPMAVALKENRPVRGQEAIAERPDGTRVSFVPYPTPLRDSSGTLVGAVNVLVDVSERREAEEALRATAEALRTSNAVKDEFLGLVSHELRTPVTTMFGNARLLLQRGDRLARHEHESMVADIAHDAERLLNIIENLLLLTRLDSGPHVDLEPQVLVSVVRRSIASFRRRHPEREVTLSCERRDLIVEADRTYLELVIENLLSNAHKYSPPGVGIEVVIALVGNEPRVAVLDRGIGIAESERARLFSTFYRSEPAKARANGLGIGLALCKRIVEIQGGRIWAEPRVDGGSEFGFTLSPTTDFGAA
jgi:PAS domain S-box-containing protein